MTGFGLAKGSVNGLTFKCELSSVNSKKGTDLILNLPREFSPLEKEIRLVVEKEVSRGRIVLTLQVLNEKNRSTNLKPFLSIDRALVKTYQHELAQLAQEIKTDKSVSLEFLLKLPGVMRESSTELDASIFKSGLLTLTQKALTEFQKSRQREGLHLAKDLNARFLLIESSQKQVATLQPKVLKRYQDQLLQRLHDAGIEAALTDERLLKEMIFFSDRSDVSEELTRLQAHLQEARRLLKDQKSSGRHLDFLIQEIGREINTTGSKANDLTISKLVIEMKTELEKIREQVQNLE